MPRPTPLPPASTSSAKAARSNFFCDLCQKGYSRMNEYEAHENSYDHQHKKRLKEMKEMQRAVVPKKEEKGGPLISVKLGGSAARRDGDGDAGSVGVKGGGWKKVGGFKNAFASADGRDERVEVKNKVVMEEEVDSDVTDDEDYYDPRTPTGCMPGCPGRVSAAG